MTVLNPPGFLQNAGSTHTAEQMRNWFGVFSAGKGSSTSLIPRGGVKADSGNALQVTQSGSPAMSVVVKSGVAAVPGSEGSKQGIYLVANDADVTLTISAAHATLNRIDRICFKVEDSGYSGVANTSSLVVVTGTPGSSPSAPTAPNNSITLATVSIVASDTSITNGEITDTRTYLAATGGKIRCTSTARPAANTVVDGQEIYETDTDRTYITHDSGSTWVEQGLGRMGATVRRSASQSLPNGAATNISYDTEDVDTHGMWAIGSPTLFTIPAGCGGVWAINLAIQLSGPGGSRNFISITPTSALTGMSGIVFRTSLDAGEDKGSFCAVIPLAAGDTFITEAFQNSGSGVNMTVHLTAYRVAI
jgi:hypothetical protein